MTAATTDISVETLTRPRFSLIKEHVQSGRWGDALACLDEARSEHEWAHDGFLHAVARVKTVVLDDFGQEAVARMGTAMPQEGLSLFAEIWSKLDFRGAVETAAAGWHWHMTKFRLREDDEKVTFFLEPCGSGGRLINEGAYYRTGPDALGLISQGSGSTFSEPEFPVYCAHCSELTGFNLGHGVCGWLVEGWTRAHRYGACQQHAYKRLSDVPDEFFARTAVDRRSVLGPASEGTEVKRVFTDEELAEMEAHPIDRLERAIQAGDSTKALAIVGQCEVGWGTMQHDSYRDWLSSWYDLVGRTYGEAEFRSTMRKSAWELFGPILRDTAGSSGYELLRAWAVFWRSHTAIESLELTEGAFRFQIDPRRLISAEIAGAWPARPVETFCSAVEAGLIEMALARRFGTLTVKGDSLWHTVPASA